MKTSSEKPRAQKKRVTAAGQSRDWTEDQKEQIARRAYELFLERGGQHGYHLEDWLKAESELAAAAPKRRRAAKAS